MLLNNFRRLSFVKQLKPTAFALTKYEQPFYKRTRYFCSNDDTKKEDLSPKAFQFYPLFNNKAHKKIYDHYFVYRSIPRYAFTTFLGCYITGYYSFAQIALLSTWYMQSFINNVQNNYRSQLAGMFDLTLTTDPHTFEKSYRIIVTKARFEGREKERTFNIPVPQEFCNVPQEKVRIVNGIDLHTDRRNIVVYSKGNSSGVLKPISGIKTIVNEYGNYVLFMYEDENPVSFVKEGYIYIMLFTPDFNEKDDKVWDKYSEVTNVDLLMACQSGDLKEVNRYQYAGYTYRSGEVSTKEQQESTSKNRLMQFFKFIIRAFRDFFSYGLVPGLTTLREFIFDSKKKGHHEYNENEVNRKEYSSKSASQSEIYIEELEALLKKKGIEDEEVMAKIKETKRKD